MLADYNQAESLCQQLLVDTTTLSRDSYVSVDKVWHLLGKIYRKQKKYEEAEMILLQALPYRRETYGEKNLVSVSMLMCHCSISQIQSLRSHLKLQIAYMLLTPLY